MFQIIMLAVSSGQHSVTVWRPSVRLSLCPVNCQLCLATIAHLSTC